MSLVSRLRRAPAPLRGSVPSGGAERGARRAAALAWVTAAALAAGCGALGNKTPSRLHALDTRPAAAGAERACALRFSVRELNLAGHLARPEVVTGRTGNRIEADADDLWAAPLATELRRIVALELADRLRGSQPVPHPWRLEEAPRLAVSIDVDRLEPAGGALQAAIGWRLVDVAGHRVLAWGRWQAQPALGPIGAAEAARADATVAAMGAALAQFTDMLAARIAADPVAGGWCGDAPSRGAGSAL